MMDGSSRSESRQPVKLYYRIGEVSQIVGVQPHVLRYWETEFRTIRPQKSPKGQRVYSRSDVERLLRVKDLLKNQGFTIDGARKRMRAPMPAEVGSARALVQAVLSPEHSSEQRPLPEPSEHIAAASQRAVTEPSRVRPARMQLVPAVETATWAESAADPGATPFEQRGFFEQPGPSAKSLRRRLVEIRVDLLQMIDELSSSSPCTSRPCGV